MGKKTKISSVEIDKKYAEAYRRMPEVESELKALEFTAADLAVWGKEEQLHDLKKSTL